MIPCMKFCLPLCSISHKLKSMCHKSHKLKSMYHKSTSYTYTQKRVPKLTNLSVQVKELCLPPVSCSVGFASKTPALSLTFLSIHPSFNLLSLSLVLTIRGRKLKPDKCSSKPSVKSIIYMQLRER